MKDGRLAKFRAELRAAVMGVLSGRSQVGQQGTGGGEPRNHAPHYAQATPPPNIPDETMILNELIREYLDWNGYRYSEQILVAGTYHNH